MNRNSRWADPQPHRTSAFVAVVTIQLLSPSSVFGRHSVRQTQRAQEQPFLTILVYNSSELSERHLNAAEANAERAFKQAGIDVRWIACPLGSSETEPASLCNANPVDSASVVLRIITAARNDGGGVRPVFGASIVASSGRSHYSTIYYGSIRQVCMVNGLYEESLLAATMTHELGHLLLGPSAHASQGIMLGRWNGPAYDQISHGKLVFSYCQAKAIREEVELRDGQSAECQTRLAQLNGRSGCPSL